MKCIPINSHSIDSKNSSNATHLQKNVTFVQESVRIYTW